MKTLEQTLEFHKGKRAASELIQAEDRFGRRFADFLTEKQMEEIGLFMKEEYKGKHKTIPFTRENILAQLKKDVEFGYEKCYNQRGISSGLMYEVVLEWCQVLEEGLENWIEGNYKPYGYPLFKAVDDKYGWGLVGEPPSNEEE